jgi:Putative zinc-finger
VIQPGEHIADQILSASIDDQLTLEEAREANAHLQTCAACRARLDELRSVVSLLAALPALEPPRDFSIGLRLVVDPPNVVRLRRWYGVARAGAASLAAAFVFLSAGALYIDSQAPATSTTGLASRVQVASGPAAAAVPAASPAVRALAPAAPVPPGANAAPPVPAPASAAAPADSAPVRATAPNSAPAPAAGAAAPAAGAPAAPANSAPASGAAAPALGAAAPAAGAAAVRARTAPTPNGEDVADQVTAATSVRPLPTPVPTLAPIPTLAPPQVAQPFATTTTVDSAAPLRTAATIVGVLAACVLLATLVVRHRLRAAAISPTE